MNDLGLGIIVSLKDAFTQNASRIQSSLQTLDAQTAAASASMTRNLGFIEKGTMMIGAGLALLAIPAALVASTTATQRALGELASVGVKDFRAMEDAAESFTNKWAGTNKAEFIGAAYDVKSALANLSDTAVGTFAAMAALTAKATKATTQEMVETFTTAYGIFKPLAKEMSDITWAQMFSGALAETVAVFKTTGPQMAEAIKNVGAIAAASLVPVQEQMAILGQLQTTMPGAEAGTLYKAFMMKVAEAGQTLGLSFVNAQGRLKGIIPILQEVKRKFPDLSQAMVQVKLKKAFGSDEAVRFLLQMSTGMDQLGDNIKLVEQAMKGGTAVTLEMANAMNMDIGSQFTLVKQQVLNLAEILGRTLLPVVIPVFQSVSRFIIHLQDVAKSMPGVTRAVLTLCAGLGILLVVVGGIISTVGTIGIVLPAVEAGLAAMGTTLAGVGTAITTTFLPVVAVIAAVILAVVLLKSAWETNFGSVRDIVTNAWNKVSLVFQGIKSLIGSLSGGTGQMSADLAEKLQAAGLLKFVTSVFQVYYRIREFLSGFWQILSASFGKVRGIIEPAVKTLIGAFAPLGEAFKSVLSIFGVAAGSVDSGSFRNFGKTLGMVLGIVVQVGAYLIKFMIYPLALVIRVIALVIQGAVWLGKTIANALVTAASYLYQFFLPLRMLVQWFVMLGRIVGIVWQVISGNVSVMDGLRSIGNAISNYLSTPFLWARDVASTVWDFLRNVFSSVGGFVSSTASALFSTLANLPIGSAIARAAGAVQAAVSGAFAYVLSAASNLASAAFESGRSVMMTLASGIKSAVMAPYDAAKTVLSRLRKLLPFSDAKEGPLSSLTASGSAMLSAFSTGIDRAAELPAKAVSRSFAAAHRLMSTSLVPGIVAGTLALTPTMAGTMPNMPITSVPVSHTVASDRPVDNVQAQTRLLAETRGSASPNTNPATAGRTDDLQSVLSALCAKLDSMSERPIEVQVITKLDGRQIAQAVYKDMKAQKVKNYETL